MKTRIIRPNAGGFLDLSKRIAEFVFPFFGVAVLFILHHIFSLTLVIRDHVNKLYTILKFLTTLRTDSSDSVEVIRNEVLFFNKVPSHLVLILGSEEPSYSDFVKIITWCLPAGISHISFYDHKNGVDANELFQHICKFAKQYIPNIKWGKSFNEDIKKQSKKWINGFRWNPALTVNIYRKEDGLERMVETVKQLYCEGVHKIDQCNLSSIMQKHFGAPDPDLAIVCGETMSFYAFPPWHLRLTQIQILKTHHNLTATKFLQQLHQFCHCEQRYGK